MGFISSGLILWIRLDSMKKNLRERTSPALKQVKGGATALVLMVMDLNQESSEIVGSRKKEIRN